MGRHATMVLALLLPAAVSIAALAQAQQPQPHVAVPDAGTPMTATPPPAAADGGATLTPAPAPAPAPGPIAPVPTSASPAPTSSTAMDGQTYAVKLRDLEQRVDELKDQINRSHTRLALLSDTIIGGGGAGSRAEVSFDNEMSSAFRLVRALFVLDGQVQYQRADDTGALADQKEIPIFSGSVPAGDHTVSVLLNFQGNGYGVFTYLRGYKFEVKSSHSFTSVEGKSLTITATALEKGGVTTPLEQRPAIEWHEKVAPLGAPAAVAAPAPAASGGHP